MRYVIYNTPIDGTKGDNQKVEVTANQQSDGSVTLSRDNGDVLSPPPLSTSVWDWKPAGTSGAYERAMLQGTVISYSPTTGYYFQYPIFELRP